MEIIERIDHWGRMTPDHLACKSGYRTLSYGELRRRSDALNTNGKADRRRLAEALT